MFHHVKNFLELTLYSGLSCSLAFVSRIYPDSFYPILIFRVSILAYTIYMISNVEQQRTLGTILAAAMFIGFIGGFWDMIEIFWVLQSSLIIYSTLAVAMIVIGSILLKRGGHEKVSKQ